MLVKTLLEIIKIKLTGKNLLEKVFKELIITKKYLIIEKIERIKQLD